MKRTMLACILAVIAIGGIIAVVYSTNNTRPTATPLTTTDSSSSSPAKATATVSSDKIAIENFVYDAAVVTVKKGTTITWTNNDSAPHTVTADGVDGPKSDTIDKGKTFSYTFDATGTFTYHCAFHANMTGTVIVTE